MKHSFLPAVPHDILLLQRFGVGDFSSSERARKCAHIRAVLARRKRTGSRPFVSVVVPAHKEEGYLLATLLSLARQTYADAEFIIVVNGEPAGSPTERLARDAGFVVLHERRGGVGRARQRGLLATRGTIVVTTDADTLHPADWLENIVREWRTTPSLVGGFGHIHTLSSSVLYRLCMRSQALVRGVRGASFIAGSGEANSWFLREAALRVGGYDVQSRYWEGSVLLHKLSRRGLVRCAQSLSVADYTSDRRSVADRLSSLVQYMVTKDAGRVPYAVVR